MRIAPIAPLVPVTAWHRWLLACVMLTVIALGWRWPQLGFIVPFAMAAGIGGAFFRGRYVCGNICPRGSFYDTLFRLVGGTRPLPRLLTRLAFRWTVAVLLLTLMGLQIARNPGDPLHWGWVFWLVCAVTTAVGVLLGLIYRPRTWCAFCPVGTFAQAIGGDKEGLVFKTSCRACGSCERVCPMDFAIACHHDSGGVVHRDCLKCGSCIAACPAQLLDFEKRP